MRILTKGILMLALPLIVELVLLGSIIHLQSESEQFEKNARHSRQVLLLAASITEPAFLQARDIRNALIAYDAGYLSGNANWTQLETMLDQLRDMVSDNPEQTLAIQNMRATVTVYRQRSDQLEAFLRADDYPAAMNLFNSNNNTSRASLEILRRQIHEFQDAEQRLAVQRTNALYTATRTQRNLMMAAVIGSILLAALMLWAFARNVSGRLRALEANARALAQGAEANYLRVTGNDEIAAVGLAIEQSSHRLRIAEDAAGQYRAELEQRALELSEANQYLRQQTLDNEMFVYSVSHDLRSPLVNLQGFSKEISHSVQDLQQVIDTLDIPTEKRHAMQQLITSDIGQSLKFIQNAVMRAANIIDAMLRLSRVGRVEYRVENIDLNNIMQRIVQATDMMIREKKVSIEIAELPPIDGDATAIEQIFGNLVGNALAYLDPARPGKIVISAQTDTLIDHDTPSITYSVRDNGLGIPEGAMSKMFRAFARLHEGVAKGEGVGLALVRRMVERHGGRIWVESVYGEGSIFFVALPLKSPLYESGTVPIPIFAA